VSKSRQQYSDYRVSKSQTNFALHTFKQLNQKLKKLELFLLTHLISLRLNNFKDKNYFKKCLQMIC